MYNIKTIATRQSNPFNQSYVCLTWQSKGVKEFKHQSPHLQ